MHEYEKCNNAGKLQKDYSMTYIMYLQPTSETAEQATLLISSLDT